MLCNKIEILLCTYHRSAFGLEKRNRRVCFLGFFFLWGGGGGVACLFVLFLVWFVWGFFTYSSATMRRGTNINLKQAFGFLLLTAAVN